MARRSSPTNTTRPSPRLRRRPDQGLVFLNGSRNACAEPSSGQERVTMAEPRPEPMSVPADPDSDRHIEMPTDWPPGDGRPIDTPTDQDPVGPPADRPGHTPESPLDVATAG